MKIGEKEIGKNKPVFVIAEAGINYNNKLDLALKMVDIAKKYGADAIKFQTFVAEEIQLKTASKPHYQFKIKKNYYDIIKDLEPSFEDQKKIFNYCKKKKIMFLSTPYDIQSVNFLDSLGVDAFKIASSDLSNHILLEHISKKHKPILLSTGMSTFQDVKSTVDFLKKNKMKNKLVLFHTTSDYPTINDDVNLRVIQEFISKFKIPVGFSDHTRDYTASLGAIAFGASVVEKHFTLDRDLDGPDQTSSLEPDELKEWIEKIRILEKSMGSSKKVITNSEKRNLTMRKVLVIKPAKKGTIITTKLLDSMRGTKNGVLPTVKNIKKIENKKLLRDITQKTQFSWKFVNS